MITIYRQTSSSANGMAVLDAPVPGCWIQAVNPDADEIKRLHDTYGVPENFITASLDTDELARVDKESDVYLIILLVPHVYEDPGDTPYSTIPLGIILTEHYIITISKIELGFVKDLASRARGGVSTAKKYRLVMQLLYANAQVYLVYLRQIDNRLDVIQRKLQTSLKNRELLELFRYQKCLTYFRTGLESNGLMMRRLQRWHVLEKYPEDEDLLEDVLQENAQATEMTKIASDILNQMMDAFASLINNNVNTVMKLLAVATIILAIPTVIASFFGMNVALPGQDFPWMFTVIVLMSITLCSLVALIVWKRDWL